VCVSLCLQTYAWLVLGSLFSEVVTEAEWLRLMDNVFSHHPSFLLICVVAYCIVGRTALLRCSERDDFEVRSFAPNRSATLTLATRITRALLSAVSGDDQSLGIREPRSSFGPPLCLYLTASKAMEIKREYYQNCFVYCQRATSSMGTVNKNSSYSPVGPQVCLFVYF